MGNKSSEVTRCFREDYQAQMLTQLATVPVPADGKIVLVDVLRMRALQVGNVATELSDPFLEMKITPGDDIAGEQIQSGTLQPSTLNPKWEPPERYRMLMTGTREHKLVLSM